jgi:exodeoxyribonuclease VII small subunit
VNPERPGLDGLLDRLEAVMARLADSGAPLERLVSDFEEASRLLEAAQVQLAEAAERVTRQETVDRP